MPAGNSYEPCYAKEGARAGETAYLLVGRPAAPSIAFEPPFPGFVVRETVFSISATDGTGAHNRQCYLVLRIRRFLNDDGHALPRVWMLLKLSK